MVVEFTVMGEPMGKQRPKASRGHNRSVIMRTPKQTVLYENLVKLTYRQEVGQVRFSDDAMLKVSIRSFCEISKSASKKKRALMAEGLIRPTKRPDWDNVGKIICDSLDGIAYKEDKQIVSGSVDMYYGEVPRVEVRIEEIESPG